MVGALATLIVLASSIAAGAPPDTSRARDLLFNALDREAALDLDSGLVLLHAAREADPWSYAVQHLYLLRLIERGSTDERWFAKDAGGDDPSLVCYDVLNHAPYGYREAAADSLLALATRYGPTLCSALGLANLTRRLTPASEWSARGVEWARWATRHAPRPADAWAWDEYGQALSLAGRASEAEAAMRTAVAHSAHPMMRVARYVKLARLMVERGDTARARALMRSVSVAVERDGRPGLRVAYLHGAATVVDGRRAWEAVAREEAAIARAHDAWPWELRARWTLCRRLDGRGDPAAAVICADRAVAIADRSASPPLRLRAYVRRGRAYQHAGQLARAETDLLTAIAAGSAATAPTLLAEAYHNLAHVREAAGRLGGAVHAAERFAELAAPLTHFSARMMSFRDLGMLRWQAGWHAAANDAFARMVRIVDEQELNYHWAGEYFERIGDLERALAYYRKAAAEPGALSVTWAALARMYDALGQPDSARWAAQRHDAHADWGPLDIPLLPDVFASEGLFREATAALSAWMATQARRENVRGVTVARIRLADLFLQWGRADSAMTQATQAESLALTHYQLEPLIEAREVLGTAQLRLGQVDDGLAMLQRAATMADSHPTADALLRTHLALGQALASVGRPVEALMAYDTAARAVEQMSASLEEDLDRARYRGRNLSPFDAAMQVLLTAEPTDPEALLRWSQRRKSAALVRSAAHALRGSAGTSPALSLPEIRRKLGRGAALLDYVVLDTTVAVTVVTQARAVSIVLPITTDRLATLVERLRRPLVTSYAGRIDLTRAQFDSVAAAELHRALMAPVLPVVGEAERLVVVPDGPIYQLPLGALPVTSNVAVVDRFEIVELPSVKLLRRSARQRLPLDRRATVLAFARDAPGVDRELRAIEAAWGTRRVVALAGAAATETRARREADRYPIVHFAAHAVADQVDPLASHIRLAPDDLNDGYLHAAEIEVTRATVTLVVLSACETSSGRRYHGEGLMSLGRAFLVGGAEGVIGTLWPVGAASADLMGAFYARLATGETPAAALRAAKIELRRNPATAHPFFWAGFVYLAGTGSGR
jgi:CHAT domain-containing protein